MSEVQVKQACVYTTAAGSHDRHEELDNVRKAVINEAKSSLSKTTCGTHADAETIYTNAGGGLLMKQLRDLQEKLERQSRGNQQLRKDLDSQSRGNQQLRKDLDSQSLGNQQLREDLDNQIALSWNLRYTTTAARRRFLIQSRLRHSGVGGGPSVQDREAIHEGNCAVHRGDLLTDGALFRLGKLEDYEEFKRLYGVGVTEALSIKCDSVIVAINKRASVIAEDENAWFSNSELEIGFQEILKLSRTATPTQLMHFEQDNTGTTDAAKAWFTIRDFPYPNHQDLLPAPADNQF